ncbi:MAG: ComF family protein [Pseudomonadota bacterium]
MRKLPQVDNWLEIIQKAVYPARCLLCDAPGEVGRDLCPACLAELPHNPVACSLCALPLEEHEEGICGACLKRQPPLDGSIIPFTYAAPLDHLLLGLKFNQQLLNARLLGGLMADIIASSSDDLPDCILPVPLHHARLRERGYNQALELARPIAKKLGVPLAGGLAVRVKHTAAQSGLEKKSRRSNLKGAFAVSGELPHHIAIIDDVVTTGSTVNELARVLRRGGAKRVVVWGCARVPSY